MPLGDPILTRLLAGVLPVVILLLTLIYLDSYKLVKLRWVLMTIAVGGLIAGMGYLLNLSLLEALHLTPTTFARYVAPVIEEIAKGLLVVFLIRTHRVGFLVDTAIYGFAVGTGFAVVENVYYIGAVSDGGLAVWIVRGFGTAIMHGGVTAIFGLSSKALSEREDVHRALAYAPGLVMACAIHSLYNHFFLTPVLSTALILVALPPLILAVFSQSEKTLEGWLNVGFDADMELLALINSGGLSESKVGTYLNTLRERFPPEVLVDMICFLKLHMELSMRAKGLLMMREAGFSMELDPEIREKFQELEFLEKSIGSTGKLALRPFLHVSGKNLWQLHMLKR